ncbi:MAG: ABC transporter ATP-binding protein [Spirochaetales bacterium]|nr:ABC transporter ATP-binding protein [Spirochaetales bacterium]
MNHIPAKHFLSLQGIFKHYRVFSLFPYKKERVDALYGVDLPLREGQVTCILGPNGAGKTTILKIIAGLVIPDEGTLAYGASARPRVGFVTPNERSFYWRLSGRENLRFFAALSCRDKNSINRRIADVIEETGLSEYADTPYRLYSTGVKQRLNIARALLAEPQLILLDEPTAHLDPLAKADFWEFIQTQVLESRKATVLLATHDLEEASVLADRVAILNRGRIVADGTITELKEKMAQNRRILLRYDTAHDSDVLQELALAAGESARDADGRVSVRTASEETVRRMVLELASRGHAPYTIEREAPSLLSIITHYARPSKKETTQ